MRIGFVSDNFRTHSCAYFLDEILADRFCREHNIYLFHTSPVFDQVTEQFKSRNVTFIDVSKYGTQDGYNKIKDFDLEVAIDIGGHTANSRLLWFAKRLAPIQINYLGYPNTTGLKNMDYKITDWQSDPDGAENYYTEHLLRMPHGFLAYSSPTDKPEPIERKDGELIFGSANQLQKLGSDTCGLFAQALETHRKSILKIKCRGIHQEEMKEHFLSNLRSYNIDTDRVILSGRDETWHDHMNWYNGIDIMIDSYPYNGVTTTCEALSMGVPVVSTYGSVHCSRACLTLGVHYDVLASEHGDLEAYLDNLDNAVDLMELGKKCLAHRFISKSKEVNNLVSNEFWDLIRGL